MLKRNGNLNYAKKTLCPDPKGTPPDEDDD